MEELVSRYKEIQEQIAKLDLEKAQIVNLVLASGCDKVIGADGIHYLKVCKAVAPKWVEEKVTPAHWDNGKRPYVRYY